MPLPHWLKSSLLAAGAALAGGGTAAWLFPAAADSSAAHAVSSRTATSPWGQNPGPPAPPDVQDYLDAFREAGTPGQQLAAALKFATLTNPAEIRALLDQARRFPAHAAGTLAAQTLLKRWLELDPAAALEYSRRHADKSLARMLGTYAVTHPAEAEAYILAMPTGTIKSEAWQELCAATAARDPDKAWALLAKSPGSRSGSDTSDDMRSLVKKLTAQDLEGTIERLSTMPAPLLKSARDAISRHLMETDPARGWEWACLQPNPNQLISNAIEVTLKKDPARAFAWLESLPASQRKRMVNEYGYNWMGGGGDSRATADALGRTPALTSDEKQKIAQRLLTRATWSDLAGAASYLPLLKGPELILGLQTYLKSYHHQHGAEGTDAWIAALPPGELQTAAKGVRQHKEQFQPVLQDRDTPADLVGAIKKGTYIQENDSRLTQINAAHLSEIIEGQTDNNSHYSDWILKALAKTNPNPAAVWFARVPLDDKTGPQAAQFTANWAQEDPAAAAAWIAGLPAGALADTAAANVARQYQRYSPAEAQTWLNSLPPGPAQDAARKAMTQN